MNLELVTILGCVAFFAGFFDAIAGGGGLITLPALFLAGIDPVTAIATNKFQAASGTFSATVAFARKGLIQWREGRYLAIFSFLGGGSGALLVSSINQTYLQAAVPVMLILVALYFSLAPKVSDLDRKQRISILAFSFSIAPLLGFYDGVFGPGVGSFFMATLTMLCGMAMLRAMSFTKLANVSCNLGSLTVFMTKGVILWPIALSMAIGAFLGAQLGARCALVVGPRLIKPMLIVVCCFLAIKLLSAPENPWHAAFVQYCAKPNEL
ncbi:TSUP family transporter [Halomonas huangheensis]|uniref:Probable membrane transporter protein n=1 Tax=Halomonas huangheensis TaxID=1178482 RepID=W1N1Y7_9GAMM|nr:TSUP family transporter [Halomonas huangheensis]ALM52421.1 hypothetical protein AR456_09110 [Halomonas huangheensis]ERL49176.1 hypothetical protein BJB45_07835 [Halomonas huangheensis]